ncbi:MAG: FkbM family methyltransferase [Thermosphaera sp.]
MYLDRAYNKFHSIQKDDVVIDVGAHAGVFILKVTRKAKRRVVAIEPHPPNYMLLLKNIIINKLENVIPMNLALSDREGVVRLHVSRASVGHTIKERTSERIFQPT